MKKKSNIILIVIFVLVVISFVTTQLTNDFFVFWAYGRFVSNSDVTGIASLIDTWEMKGLLFKAYLYVEYALTAPFSSLFDSYGQTIYKIIGIIPFLFILGMCIVLLPKRFVPCKINKTKLFLYSSILLLTVHFASHFQAEMWGVVFLLLAFSVYLRDGWGAKLISAVIYSLTFYLKSPIPLLGGSLVIAAMMLKKQSIKEAVKDVVPFAIGTIAFLVGTLLLISKYYPQELTDIWSASYYQHTLFHDYHEFVQSIAHFVWHLFLTIFYNPIVTVGLICAILLLVKYKKSHSWANILLIIGVWLFPMFYVLLSNRYFEYHYYLLSFSALLTILLLINEDIIIDKRRLTISSIVFVTFYAFVLSSVCPTNLFEKKYYSQTQNQLKEETGIYVGCKLGEDDVFFMDSGIGAFYFANKSYLRYFYPLPLERIRESDPYASTDAYKEIKQKAMDYEGQYVVIQKDWFLSDGNNADILQKIDSEYFLEKEIIIPNYSWQLFISKEANSTLSIYKRKCE